MGSNKRKKMSSDRKSNWKLIIVTSILIILFSLLG
jgi:hypothetical protein